MASRNQTGYAALPPLVQALVLLLLVGLPCSASAPDGATDRPAVAAQRLLAVLPSPPSDLTAPPAPLR